MFSSNNVIYFILSEIEQIKREIAIRKRERISINLLMRPEVNIVYRAATQ